MSGTIGLFSYLNAIAHYNSIILLDITILGRKINL